MEEQQNLVMAIDRMKIIYQSDTCTVRRYEDEAGTLVRAQHEIFPGITLLYKSFHRGSCTFHVNSYGPNILSIEHCLEGRVEFQTKNECFYLEAGDVVLRRMDGARRCIHFPADNYQGINIDIDLNKTPRCLSCILADVEVEPMRLVNKFGLNDSAFHYLRKNEHLEHIFREFYYIPDPIRRGYLKVKTLEILLFLTGMELPEYQAFRRRLAKRQIELAKEAHAYIAEHTNEHMTIAEIAGHFGVSQTQLKESFRNVYGTTVQGFILEQKMRAAAEMIQNTDRKISDIALEFGYVNASKFSAAFQRVMGCLPAQYRMKEENPL